MTVQKVFVFGSNEAGIHGAGAAKDAYRNHAAKMGCGFGYCSNSVKVMDAENKFPIDVPLKHSFAIPTKDYNIQTLPIEKVESYVEMFLDFADTRTDLKFKVSRIGCGLAGFKDTDIATLFRDYESLYGKDSNLEFDSAWKPYLPKTAKFWGTFGQEQGLAMLYPNTGCSNSTVLGKGVV